MPQKRTMRKRSRNKVKMSQKRIMRKLLKAKTLKSKVSQKRIMRKWDSEDPLL